MRLIPVVDMQGGEVVRAIAGVRRQYRALHSPVGVEPKLGSVGGALVDRFSLPALYIADLDAIEGVGSHRADINQFCASHPKLEVWLDSGVRKISDLVDQRFAANIKPVIGTETFVDPWPSSGVMENDQKGFILSLDFRGGQVVGNGDILNASDNWPERVIVMTMDAVGKNAGPDFQALRLVLAKAGERHVFAAGGVRSVADLKLLGEMGVAGALVSTALHNGQIKTSDLKEIAGF